MHDVSPLPAKEAWLARPLERATEAVLRRPRSVLAVAAVTALAAMALAGARLGYKTGRLDLLDPQASYNRLWIEYLAEFGDQDDAVVVVDGPARQHVVSALDDLSETLARQPQRFQALLHEVDLSRVRAKGLHYLSPEQLRGIEQFLDGAVPIVRGQWSLLNVAARAERLRAQLDINDPRAAIETQRLAAGLLSALTDRRHHYSPWPEIAAAPASAEFSGGHLLANGGRRGFVLLRLAPGEDSFARGSAAIDALREQIARVQARHPQAQIGLTGVPVLENDEMRSSSSDMLGASLLSLAGVAALFAVGFGGLRHAVAANLVLLAGMAWAFAYATLAVGHLNILSVSFTVTLIGIGIDYGIHYIARYLHLRREALACREALLAASRGVGPAIVTGAVTTAVAFFAAAFTSFTGIAELGLIAGGGLLLCAAAQLFVLPAALVVMDESEWGARLPAPWRAERWLRPLFLRPRGTLAVTLGVTALAAVGLGGLRYDHNLLNLQAESLDSVKLERKLLAESDQSAWYALSIADSRQELLARKQRLQRLPAVERVEEVASLLPDDAALKQPIVERIHERLTALPTQPPVIGVDRPAEVERALAGLCQRADRLDPQCRRQLDEARQRLLRLSPVDCFAALAQYQQQTAEDLLARLRSLRSVANPQPPTLGDLPPGLVQRFVGKNQRHLLKVYGRGNLWEMSDLAAFVAQVRSVDPRATGNPLQAYEASREMKHSYELAALYALGVILVVLVLDFRSLRLALLAALPLGLGIVQAFGLLAWLNVPLNPANIIALPLMLGIGIDYGVHIVHEYAASQGPYRLSRSTAVAVLIDSLTTIIGFASLLIAAHRGLASIGLVLSIGVGCCLFASLAMLPALLSWLSRNREASIEEAAAAIPLRRAA